MVSVEIHNRAGVAGPAGPVLAVPDFIMILVWAQLGGVAGKYVVE